LHFLAAPALLAGCRHETTAPPDVGAAARDDAPFVALYVDEHGRASRGPSAGGAERPGDTFYLAVRRDALDERWFLSAYLKQLHPGGDAAYSLGTRVVSLRVQNGKVFVFDVDGRKAASDAFDPEVVLEAYPLVDPGELGAFAGRDRYVVFDPAAGLNRFSALNDAERAAGVPAYDSRLEVEVSYSQRFRALDDGIAFEQVFSGYFEAPDRASDPAGVEPNPFRASGTLALALRRYRDGEGFAPKPLPERELYFRSPPRLVPNAGFAEQSAVRWNLKPGGAPVRWSIAPAFAELQQRLGGEFDLVGAVKRGVESWNAAFGFEALEAELAAPGQSFADDDVNYVLLDEDPAKGFAFADFRLNPNTGEIRGASVYYGAGVIYGVLPPPGAAGGAAASAARAPRRLAWGGWAPEPLCAFATGAPAFAGDAPAEGLTPKERVEAYVAHIAAHEIGHALGLRHNFKGSLAPPSSSVMDYLSPPDAVGLPGPGPFDVDAVRHLYDLSPAEPAQPFCTDEDVAVDPTCNRYDQGADPLRDELAPLYQKLVERYLRGQVPPAQEASYFRFGLDFLALDLLDFVRAPEVASEDRLAAWDATFAPLRPALGSAWVPAKADAWAGRLLGLVFPDGPDAAPFADSVGPPAADPALSARSATDLRDVIAEGADVYGVGTKGRAIDVLARLQTAEALVALADARAALAARLPSLAGAAAALTGDLIARIDRATDPYFDLSPPRRTPRGRRRPVPLAPCRSAAAAVLPVRMEPVVAVVGATGVVGREMLATLARRQFPAARVVALASARSAGKAIEVGGRSYPVEEARPEAFAGVDVALFSAGAAASRALAPAAAAAGAVVIDNSSAWRMDPGVPLVVPEVNAAAAADRPKGIIANPNCSTIQMLVALAPLHRAARLRHVVVSTYQAASGKGQAALDELHRAARAAALGEPFAPEVFPGALALNVLSDWKPGEGDYSEEELKMVNETRKILGDPSVGVSPTAVRVPVPNGHAESVHAQFHRPMTAAEARALLRSAPGVALDERPYAPGAHPQPRDASGRDEVFVGRVRDDLAVPGAINLWVVADNLRKGAALNAVQIAELLLESRRAGARA
jgi:aspartate-semialdehyde dehydrogenase